MIMENEARARIKIDKYHIKDARRIDKLLSDKKMIDVTITSPPYWNLKDYGYKNQIGFGQSYNQYLNDIKKVFEKIYDRTKSSGSLWIIADTFKQGGELQLLPFDISEKLKSVGWILQDVIIWQKDKSLPWSHQGKLRNIFEYISFYTKSHNFKYHSSEVKELCNLKDYWVQYPERYSPEGKTPSRSWDFPIPQQGSWGGKNNYVRHACPLPQGLIERIIKLSSNKGDTILDPFAGSGTVLAMAQVMDRHYIGIDKNIDYKIMFHKSVLPSVKKTYISKNGGSENKKRLKQKFAKLIVSLRKLKYPKELIRLYDKKHGFSRCSAVIAFTNNKNREFYLVFVFESLNRNTKKFIEKAEKICSQAPLSKYGTKPKIIITSVTDISGRQLTPRGLKSSKQLYLYKNGQFYHWQNAIKAKDIRTIVQNGDLSEYKGDRYPPIISTIKLRINPQKPELIVEGNHG